MTGRGPRRPKVKYATRESKDKHWGQHLFSYKDFKQQGVKKVSNVENPKRRGIRIQKLSDFNGQWIFFQHTVLQFNEN